MPSDVPRERLPDIISNIDRLRAPVRGVAPGESLDDKTRDAVSWESASMRTSSNPLGHPW